MKWIALLLLALLVFSCSKETPAEPEPEPTVYLQISNEYFENWDNYSPDGFSVHYWFSIDGEKFPSAEHGCYVFEKESLHFWGSCSSWFYEPLQCYRYPNYDTTINTIGIDTFRLHVVPPTFELILIDTNSVVGSIRMEINEDPINSGGYHWWGLKYFGDSIAIIDTLPQSFEMGIDIQYVTDTIVNTVGLDSLVIYK